MSTKLLLPMLLLLLQVLLFHLELTQSDHLESIKYDQNNGFDYYYAAADDPNESPPSVTTNFKSILPSNLARPQADPSEALSSDGSGLPQVANNLQIVRGNGPRGRSAKQLRQPVVERDSEPRASTNGENVCLTPGCVKAAAEILNNIDERVEPCDDFYRYACGNWIESQIIPEDKTSVSLFSLVQDELDNKLRNLIERQTDKKSETPIVRRMRNLYESCMNTSEYRNFWTLHIEHINYLYTHNSTATNPLTFSINSPVYTNKQTNHATTERTTLTQVTLNSWATSL